MPQLPRGRQRARESVCRPRPGWPPPPRWVALLAATSLHPGSPPYPAAPSNVATSLAPLARDRAPPVRVSHRWRLSRPPERDSAAGSQTMAPVPTPPEPPSVRRSTPRSCGPSLPRSPRLRACSPGASFAVKSLSPTSASALCHNRPRPAYACEDRTSTSARPDTAIVNPDHRPSPSLRPALDPLFAPVRPASPRSCSAGRSSGCRRSQGPPGKSVRSAADASLGQTPEPGVVLPGTELAALVQLPLAIRAFLLPLRDIFPRRCGVSASLPRSLLHVIFGLTRRTPAPARPPRVSSTDINGRMLTRTPSLMSGSQPTGCSPSGFQRTKISHGGLAGHESSCELLLQVPRRREPPVRSLDAVVPVGPLPGDPLPEVAPRQRLERPATLAVRTCKPVVVHQGVESVAAAVPDVPHEGALLEKPAVLLEEAVAQPRLKGLGRPVAGRRRGQ